MDVHYPKVEHKNVNDQKFVDELSRSKTDGHLQIPTRLFSEHLPFPLPVNYYVFIDMSPSIGSAQHFIFLKKLFLNFVKYK